jgi:hypothetical protein
MPGVRKPPVSEARKRNESDDVKTRRRRRAPTETAVVIEARRLELPHVVVERLESGTVAVQEASVVLERQKKCKGMKRRRDVSKDGNLGGPVVGVGVDAWDVDGDAGGSRQLEVRHNCSE